MKYSSIRINNFKKKIVISSIFLFLITNMLIIITLMFPSTVDAFQMRQDNQRDILLSYQLIPSATITSPAPLPISPTPTVDEHVQQLITEAQNDISTANTVIYWTGFIFAVIVGIVTVGVGIAGFAGVREFRDLFRNFQQVRTDIGSQFQQVADQLQQMTVLKKQIEDQRDLLANQVKGQFQAVEDQREQFTNQIISQLQAVEDRFRQLTKATEIQSIMDASYNFGIATNAYEVGNNFRAIDSYLKVLALQPNNTRVLERLGRAYSNVDKIDESVKCLEKALSIDPNYEPALRSLALSYRYSDKSKAISYLERELQVNPSDYEGWDFLGLFYRDEGNFDKAIHAHEQALRFEPRPETEFYLCILYSLKGEKKRAYLLATLAEDDISKKEHEERIRPVWKILIRAAIPIIDGKKEEALTLVQTLTPYITTQRIYEAVKGHLKFLLESTNEDWIPEIMKIIEFKRN